MRPNILASHFSTPSASIHSLRIIKIRVGKMKFERDTNKSGTGFGNGKESCVDSAVDDGEGREEETSMVEAACVEKEALETRIKVTIQCLVVCSHGGGGDVVWWQGLAGVWRCGHDRERKTITMGSRDRSDGRRRGIEEWHEDLGCRILGETTNGVHEEREVLWWWEWAARTADLIFFFLFLVSSFLVLCFLVFLLWVEIYKQSIISSYHAITILNSSWKSYLDFSKMLASFLTCFFLVLNLSSSSCIFFFALNLSISSWEFSISSCEFSISSDLIYESMN